MKTILDYVLEQPIGTGDGTIVYRARRLPGDELVAIKVASPDLTGGALERVEARLRSEADLLRRAIHPAIVPFGELIDGGIDPGEGTAPVALVLGLASRGSLHDVVSTDGGLPPGEVVTLGVVLAGALTALHAADIVHGDLSTGNVLLNDDGPPWLADLGDAGVTGRSARPRGTEGFAAPEVTAGGSPDPASDIYALGRVLRAALGPSDADDPDDPDDPTIDHRPVGSLDEILGRATDPDPGARPTAAALTSQLSQLAGLLGGVTAGTRVGPAAAVTRDFGPGRPLALARPALVSSRPRRRSAALMVVGAAVAGAVAIGLVLTLTSGAPTAGPVDPAAAVGTDPVLATPVPVIPVPVLPVFGDPVACPGSTPSVAAGAVAVAGDPDARGCLITVTWWPDRAEAERFGDSGVRVRFALGDPGDQLLLGDWDDDGRDTPALYRPATGQVTRFDGWADTGQPVTGSMVVGDQPRDGLARVERRAGGDQVVVDPAPVGN